MIMTQPPNVLQQGMFVEPKHSSYHHRLPLYRDYSFTRNVSLFHE